MKKWNDPEIKFLEEYYPIMTAKEIGEVLHFSTCAVSTMASKMKLKKAGKSRANTAKRADFHQRYLDELHAKTIGVDQKIKYTTRPAMLGGEAENYFSSLVPDAIDVNNSVRLNNPEYDFIFDGLTIDVKFASYRKKRENWSPHWSIRTSGNCDIIVAFLENNYQQEIKEPHIIVIPRMVINSKKIEIHQGGKWWRLIVAEKNLKSLLQRYANVNKETTNSRR